uniref:Zgc:174888 n=2 Tax=Cyprinus carpio TaxID=7962 RepID=A0A8C1QP02_CYPCA
MSPTVLLLLSILTVQGSGCDDFMKTTIKNLQASIHAEKTSGFPQVFPKNYVVSHYFNESALCNETCCVFSAAAFLSNSWRQLLQHLSRVHLKYSFITKLIYRLDNIASEKIPDSPDVSDFPSVQSSPEGLLSFTSSLFTRWLDLNCAFGEHQCIFPTPSEEDQDNPPLEEEPNVENHEPVDEQQQPETEGETDKRQLDECPTNGYRESLFPGWSHWTFSFLWITSSLIW